ncbi:MAG: zinc ribbon domain-containing protein [Gemmatimonadetes bacterium]|nr:zinc ribbon domain-containing protein [Gemmatimonadota bacterium]
MASPASRKCTACGAESTGKFCAECGAPLGSIKCPACGAQLSARAKFCAECGTPTGRPASHLTARAGPSGPDRTAWIVAGIAVLALLVTVVVVVARRSPGAAGAPQDLSGPATTDLSQLSPREAADRLYDRVARATEAGDTAQVRFFGPMALQAYDAIGTLDPDARLHLGLIHLATGDTEAAAAQADTIQRLLRPHLFGPVLRARAAEARGDAAAARRAYQDFLANYDAERAANRAEYEQHAQILDETQRAAQRLLGATAGS